MRKKIVIALGGNALGKTPEEQLELVKITAKNIVDLVAEGNKVIVTHGNGPQVGMINLAMEVSNKQVSSPEMPFAECGAMSQGYIGYHLQQSIQKELEKRHMRKNCITVVTQVEVDKKDLAFKNPTKPIGDFYTKEEAESIAKSKGYIMKEDANRGYRRVVASPIPKKIVEIKTIKKLIDNGEVVIACGGGGIPVVRHYGSYKGIDAVIDKDRTSARLARDIKADILLILTAVDTVCINYGKEDEEKLKLLTFKEAKKLIDEKQFAEGSMLPKIEASLEFVKTGRGKAIITSLDKALSSLKGTSGTVITKN